MAKYLDWGGLQTFWSKIKTWVGNYANITTNNSLTKINIGSNDVVPVTGVTAGVGLNTTSNDTATDGGTIGGTNNSGTLYLSKSGVTAGSYGPSANATPAVGDTFDVPQITVDKYGRVTAASTKTVTTPSDTKVTQNAAISTNGNYPILLAYDTNTTEVTNVVNKSSDLKFNPSTGNLTSGTFNGMSIEYGAGTWSIGSVGNILSFYNSYTLGAACAKSVDTSIGSSSSSNLPTTDAVKSYVSSQMSSVAGALVYKGTVSAQSTLLDTALEKGWYYIVSMPDANTTNVTIGEVECEAGDMIIVNTSGTYTTAAGLGAAIDVIQTNISIITDNEINNLS